MDGDIRELSTSTGDDDGNDGETIELINGAREYAKLKLKLISGGRAPATSNRSFSFGWLSGRGLFREVTTVALL